MSHLWASAHGWTGRDHGWRLAAVPERWPSSRSAKTALEALGELMHAWTPALRGYRVLYLGNPDGTGFSRVNEIGNTSPRRQSFEPAELHPLWMFGLAPKPVEAKSGVSTGQPSMAAVAAQWQVRHGRIYGGA
jgi:hypothetical protein